MIELQSFADSAGFGETEDGKKCIAINNVPVLFVKQHEYEDYDFLESVFNVWLKYNYPSFWRNPLKYIFGGHKSYDSLRIFKDFYPAPPLTN